MWKRVRCSFAARLNLYILSSLTLLFLIALGIFFHYASRSIEKNAYKEFNNMAEKTNLRITHLLRKVEKIPDNMGFLISEYVTNPDILFDVTRQVVRNNDEIFGCAIAFEPDYFPEKGKYFGPYSYMEGDSVVTISLDANYDYYRKNWYRLTKEHKTPRWSRPYHDFGDQSVITTTYSVPLYDNSHKIIGVFSVDLSLEYITKLIDSDISYPSSYTVVVNAQGKYVIGHYNGEDDAEKPTIIDIAVATKDPSAVQIAEQIVSGYTGKEVFYNQGIKSYVFYCPLKGTEWYMAIICTYDDIFANFHYFNLIVITYFIILLLLIYLLSSIAIKKVTKPLKTFAQSARNIASGKFNTPLPRISSCDEMKELHDSFQDMQTQLTQYIRNLQEATSAKEKMESELRIAHEIQMGMLPKDFTAFDNNENIDLYALLNPARAVGGDFYDFFIQEDHLYFAIGDVSGKGIPASLLMSFTISLLRSLPAQYSSPADIVKILNNSISERNEADMFVTFFIGILNLKTGLLRYSNAGHMPPVITYPDRSISFFDIHADLPLGVSKDYPYQEYTYALSSGSGILLYTDGVTEAENIRGEFYTKERLLDVIHQNKKLHPREFIKKIMEDVRTHVQEYEQSDDLTLLTLIYGQEWHKKNEAL